MVMEVSISGRHNGHPISGHARRLEESSCLPERYRGNRRRTHNKTKLPPDVAFSLKMDWIAGKLSIRTLAAKYGLGYEAIRMYARRAGWPAKSTRPIGSNFGGRPQS